MRNKERGLEKKKIVIIDGQGGRTGQLLIKRIKEADISQLMDYIRNFKEEGMDIRECLDFMQMWYRDVLMYKTTKDVNLLIFKDEFSSVKAAGVVSGYDGLEKILNA